MRTERLNLCAYVEELDDAAWRTPSLCTEWTVREVVAHLTTTTRATIPSVVALPSLVYVAANRFLGGPKRVAGLELVATDAAWSSGEGPAVHGTVADLLLAAAGRPAALTGLSGPGVELLAPRLA
ncbi:maleylpyruvate isomerase N-terminal domain-containing protein [Pseudonocardia sp. NPDC049154]|uniref:maleylpyruvate isomerase N-terminal domain-containing protein n=1 Tax=Pseudonocardia sp. NPDC049154 TaxID=3155501 RepID=UPI0034028F95